MNCIDENGKEVIFPKDVYVLVLIDSLYQNKTLAPHHSLLEWKKEFHEIQVPVYIVSPDKSYQVIQGGFHYLCDPDLTLFKKYGGITNKMVFGKKHKIIQFTILLMDGDRVVDKHCRWNTKTIYKLYLKALHLRYQVIQKNVKNKLTKNRQFVNI